VHRAENLTTSCANCREIWEPHPPGTVRACPGLYRDCFIFFSAALYGTSHCGLVYCNALEGSNTWGYRVFYCALESYNTSGYRVFYCALEDQDALEYCNISGYKVFYCALEDQDALESCNTSGYIVFYCALDD